MSSDQLRELQNQIIKLQDQVVQSPISHSKSARLPEQKSFTWDTLILIIATTIVGLSISDAVVEFLKPESSKVTCFVPQFDSRDQVQYVNEFCHHALPYSVNLTIALVIQGILLVAVHYVWRVAVSASIDSYFTHVANMETLRDRNTGEYPDKNFGIVEYTNREFRGKKFIVYTYVAKLVTQIVVVIGAGVVNGLCFKIKDFDVKFFCEDNILFGNVTCSFAKFQYLLFLYVMDFILLGMSFVVLVGGLYWFAFKSHTNLGYEDIAEFCYQSCINSKFYSFKFTVGWCWYLFRKKQWKLVSDDLNFLHFLLLSTNAGLGRVFKSVQIANNISDKFYEHLELPINETGNITTGSSQTLADVLSSLSELSGSCQVLDIASGYHNYLFSLAKKHKQVVSIVLDPYYIGKAKKVNYRHSKIELLRIPANLYGLPDLYRNDFRDNVMGKLESGHSTAGRNKIMFNAIIVSALDSKHKRNTVNQILRFDEFIPKDCYLVTLQPILNGYDSDWKPPQEVFDGERRRKGEWLEEHSPTNGNQCSETNGNQRSETNGNQCSEIMIKCSDIMIRFRKKIYKYSKTTN